MPPMLSKTLMALVLLLCVTPCVYVLAVLVWDQFYTYRMMTRGFLVSNLITGAVLYVLWILLWRREVRWTLARRVRTLACLAVAAIPAALVYGACALLSEPEVGMLLAGLTWAAGWLGATTIIWRETPLERAQRSKGSGEFTVRCPSCEYEMTGLHEARCPECGTSYTLDQLLGAQVKEDPLSAKP